MRKLIVLLVAVLLLCCTSNVDPKLILKKSEGILSKNFEAKATFEMYVQTPKFTDRTEYVMEIIKVGNMTKITFLNYSFSPKTPVHERMKIALKNAWLIEKDGYFYLYTPNLKYMKGKVGMYKISNGIPRYTYLPIITCLDVARTFDKAEDVKLVGKENECYVISYELSYPTVRFTDKANVKVWIHDYVPIKAEITAKFHSTDIRMITEFENIEMNVTGVNLSLEGLTVLKRY